MKTILLLVSSLFLISQFSFAKAPNTTELAGDRFENFKVSNVNFATDVTVKKPVIVRNRVWLNLTNSGGAFKQILVGYITGATNGWDRLYDSVTLDSNPYVDFYSINDNTKLSIQGRALPFVDTDEVPLGYRTTISGTFLISIDHVDGLFVTHDVFLKDTTTGLIHNLKDGAYSFETSTGVFDDRFVLLYVDTTPLAREVAEETIVVQESAVSEPIVVEPAIVESVVLEPVVTIAEVPATVISIPVIDNTQDILPTITDDVLNQNTEISSSSMNNKGNSVIVSVNNNQITVHSGDEIIKEVSVYNIGQMQLFQKRNINTNEFIISNLDGVKQFLIIKTKLKKGNWVTNKIIL